MGCENWLTSITKTIVGSIALRTEYDSGALNS